MRNRLETLDAAVLLALVGVGVTAAASAPQQTDGAVQTQPALNTQTLAQVIDAAETETGG